MNKCICFPFLKFLFCFLFFAASVVLFGVIIPVPDTISNTSDNIFYVEYDANRNLWFGMELLTSSNVGWWKERLAYEAYIYTLGLKDRFPSVDVSALKKIYLPFIREIERNHEFVDLYQSKSWSLAHGILLDFDS